MTVADDRIQVARDARIVLDRTVDDVTRQIVEAYARTYAVLAADLEQIAVEAAREALDRDGRVGPAQLRQGRLAEVMRILELQLADLGRLSGVTISGRLPEILEASEVALLEMAQVTGASFNLPQDEALRALVLRVAGRIEAASRPLSAEAGVVLRDALLRGFARGESPQTVARNVIREVRGEFGGGLTRALVIARTELLDASREHTRLAYVGSDQVVGHRWLAALDLRTCPSCLARHNTVLEPFELVEDHQQGRCTSVPILAGEHLRDSDLGDAESWFRRLPRSEQLQVMGPSRLEALDRGVPFSALSERRPSAGWRPSYGVRAVRDLVGAG